MKEKYCFKVNGVVCSTEENKPLLRYLRDDLHLHSVKDGCSEGACGTCTIVVVLPKTIPVFFAFFSP